MKLPSPEDEEIPHTPLQGGNAVDSSLKKNQHFIEMEVIKFLEVSSGLRLQSRCLF